MIEDGATAGKPPISAPIWERRAISTEELRTEPVQYCWNYWSLLRAGRPYPRRSEISPREMAPILRNVAIFAALENGAQFEPRIIGDFFVHRHGASSDNALESFEQEHPGFSLALRRVFLHVAKSQEPIALRGSAQLSPDGSPTPWGTLIHETLCLPLGEPGVAISHILLCASESDQQLRKPNS